METNKRDLPPSEEAAEPLYLIVAGLNAPLPVSVTVILSTFTV